MEINFPVKFYKKQLEVLKTADDPSISDVLVDGSKGSGKSLTAASLAYYIGMRYKNIHIGMFRRTLPELRETLQRYALETYPKGTYKFRVADRRILFPTKSQISLNYIETDADLLNYQGWNFQVILLDESTNFTEYQIGFLKTQLRITNEEFGTKIYFFTNPIGISHGYFKSRFVDDKKSYTKYETPESITFRKLNNDKISTARYLIRFPMMTEENIKLMQNDPQYLSILDALPEKERMALRFGSWEVCAGLFFSQFDKKKHVIDSYQPQINDTLFISCDWGTSKPFAIYWYAINSKDKVIVYREYYGIKGTIADEGIGYTAVEVAQHICEKTPHNEKIKYMVLDSACWAQHGQGYSIYELMQSILKDRSIYIIQSHKNRMNGWEAVKKYLLLDETGEPSIYFTKECKHLLRTLPFMMYDKNKENDLDSRSEDHACDSLAYFLMSRPMPKKIRENKNAPFPSINYFKNLKKQKI